MQSTGRGLSLTFRLCAALGGAALFLATAAALLGFTQDQRQHREKELADTRRFSQVLSERIAPLLHRGDREILEGILATAVDLGGYRVLVLDQDGVVTVDTAFDRDGEPLGLAAGASGLQRMMQIGGWETLQPIRFGGQVIGEVRLRQVLGTAAHGEGAWFLFALVIVFSLTLIGVATWLVHHWVVRVRLASAALRAMVDGGSPSLPTTGSGREMTELLESIVHLDQVLAHGADRVATSLITMGVQMVDALERRGQATPGHGERTGRYGILIAERLGLSSVERRELELASRVHELGKMWVRPSILAKDGPLTSLERESYRQYPVRGADAFEGLPSLEGVSRIIRHHRERYDGGGFPESLRGERVPLGARILAIAAAYDELTSLNFEGQAVGWEEALGSMGEDRGVHFDPVLLDLFCEEIRKAPQPQHADQPVLIDPPQHLPYKKGERVALDEDEGIDMLTIEELELMFDDNPEEEGGQ